MKTPLLLVLSFVLGLAPLGAQEKAGFATHAFFKLLIGSWKSEGELKGKDGNVIPVKEEWKASITSEGTFTMEGSRKMGEGEHDFRWTLSPTATTGIYEVSHYTSDNGGSTQHFEASVSEADLTMTFTTALGDSTLKLSDAFTDKEHNTLVTKVELTDAKGEPNLSGSITHQREKKE